MDNMNTMTDSNDGLFEKLMSCPLKRQLILNLIASEKDKIEEYKKTVDEKKSLERTGDQALSPFRKVRKKYQCESPTALLRRRALEQNKNAAESRQSLPKQSSASSVPWVSKKILEGVVAFIDMKSKDYDRSTVIKALLHSMGATIKSQFDKEVTHVIFKDGSFSTYQKAKLINVHLVSVLWIEACRNSGMKVDEDKFPALGTEVYDHNISALCSQLQKDYEEIVKEEFCRSLSTGSPLPSTRTLIDKRRTIMTPNISNSSFAEEKLSQEFLTLRDRKKNTNNFATLDSSSNIFPETIQEEGSDLEACIAGQIIQKEFVSFPGSRNGITVNKSTEHEENSITFDSHMSLEDSYSRTTELNNTDNLKVLGEADVSSKENSPPNTPNGFYTKATPKISRFKAGRSILADEYNENLPDKDDSLCKRRTRSVGKKINFTTVFKTDSTNEVPPYKKRTLPKPASKDDSSKFDVASSSNVNEKVETSIKTNISSERVNKLEKSSSTNMSTLQLSNNHMDNSSNTNMSQLQIDSDTNKNAPSFNSNNSFSPIQPSDMKSILEILDTSSQSVDYVTRRRKRLTAGNLVSNRCKNDDSRNSDKNENIMAVNSGSCSKKSLVRQRKKNSACSEKNKSEILQHGNLLSEATDTKRNEKAESFANTVSDASENSITNNISVRIVHKKIGEDSFNNNENEKNENSKPELLKVDENHKASNDQYISKRKKSVNGTARKLYDPYDYSHEHFLRGNRHSENIEENAKICNNSVEPRVILSQRAKKFVAEHEINLDKILHEQSVQLRGRKSKLPKRNEPVQKHITDSANEHKLNKLVLEQKGIEKCDDKNLQIVKNELEKENEDCVNRRFDEVGIKKMDSTSSRKKPRKTRCSEAADKIPKRRYSQRLFKHSSKASTDISKPEKKVDPDMPLQNRRSTKEFQTKINFEKKKIKTDKLKQTSIVCTKMHKDEIVVFTQIVNKLGGFFIEDEVTRKTTHLVAGEPRRTINMLRAIATGCWIVSREWLFQSLEAGKWIPEEDYELTDFSPAVEQCRLQRQAFGASYSMDIFHDCGAIYIAKGSTPRCSDLKELVTLCKGNCTAIARNSKIVVGEMLKYDGVICVKENWILDSIKLNRKMPLKNYVISPNRTSDVF